jgi:hypothetical protein
MLNFYLISMKNFQTPEAYREIIYGFENMEVHQFFCVWLFPVNQIWNPDPVTKLKYLIFVTEHKYKYIFDRLIQSFFSN